MIIPGFFGGGDQNLPLQFVGGKSAQSDVSTSLDVSFSSLVGGIASSPSSGDFAVLVAAIASTGAASIVTDGKWTEQASVLSTDTRPVRMLIATGFIASDTSIEISSDSGSYGRAVTVHVWRGVDPTTPLDVAIQTAGQTNTVLADPPSITPITAGANVIVMGAGGHGFGSEGFDHASLEEKIFRDSNGADDSCVGMGFFDWTSGAYDPAAFTFSGVDSTDYSAVGACLALRPANPD